MKALLNWAKSKKGNISRLSEALDITQPAVSKWFLQENKRGVPINYAKKIMLTTGLSAKDIYPEMYDLFKSEDYRDGVINRHNILTEKTERLTRILNKIDDLHEEAASVIRELNNDDL